MGLVEGVAGEGFDEIEYLHRQLSLKPFGLGPGDEVVPLLRHQRGDLLAHRLPDDIGGAQGISGELLQDQQHLVLVDDNAVGLVQQFLEAGMRVGDGRPAVLGLNESLYVLHGTRPVQGDHGRDIAEVGRLQLLDVTLHSGAFKLEQVGGVPRRQQLEGGPVVQGQALQVDLDSPVLLYELDRPVQDREVGEAQEVHFQQAQLRHRVHGELGHQHRAALVASGRALQRDRLR